MRASARLGRAPFRIPAETNLDSSRMLLPTQVFFLPFSRSGFSGGGLASVEHMVNGGLAFEKIFRHSNKRIGATVVL
jgi:hypothetical protein